MTLFRETHYGFVTEVGDRVTVVYETDDDEVTHEYDRSQFAGEVPSVGQRVRADVVVSGVPENEGRPSIDKLMSYGEGVPLSGDHEF